MLVLKNKSSKVPETLIRSLTMRSPCRCLYTSLTVFWRGKNRKNGQFFLLPFKGSNLGTLRGHLATNSFWWDTSTCFVTYGRQKLKNGRELWWNKWSAVCRSMCFFWLKGFLLGKNLGDEIVSSYIGIILSQYKDSFKPPQLTQRIGYSLLELRAKLNRVQSLFVSRFVNAVIWFLIQLWQALALTSWYKLVFWLNIFVYCMKYL